MIVYDLICSKGHGFSEWFTSMSDYDAKASANSVPCPECGDTHVSKAIMAPSIGKSAAAVALACGAPACANMGCPAQRG